MNCYSQDIAVLRELAKQTVEEANREHQEGRRSLWRDFNSRRTHRVPIYILDPQGISREVLPEKNLMCHNRLFRQYEFWMRLQLYHASFGDDYIIEPYITVKPEYTNSDVHWRTWGVNIRGEVLETQALRLPKPIITKLSDLDRLVLPLGIIDGKATAEKNEQLNEAVGDIIPIIPDNFPQNMYLLSYLLGCLLGPEQLLYLLIDQPDLIHEMSRIIAEGSCRIFDEAEKQGLLSNCDLTFMGNAQIQAMAYCHELPSPGQYQKVTMRQHWIYDNAQEFECVSPEMFDEFFLRYQIPLYSRFGLTAFGCCENLTEKIKYLRKIPNLRRIAVTAWADTAKCAQQIGNEYVISWRPNPADMITRAPDQAYITKLIQQVKQIFSDNGCYWEINLKDFLTVENDYNRLKNWVSIVRNALNEY